MLSFLSAYAIPLIGSAVLALFAKPNDKTVLQNIVSVVKPASPTNDVLKLLPGLLEQLLKKSPPADPDNPLPAVDAKNPQDVVNYVLSLLSMPDVKVDVPSVVQHGDISDLVACANAVAANNPEYDIQVTINETGVQCVKVKRVKPE